MADSINKVILVGNVGSEPQIRIAQGSSEELATFSVATSEKWKDKNSGQLREKTDWHRVVIFSLGLVKIVKEYVNKGSRVYIEGKMQTRVYEGNDKIKRYTTEVILTQYSSNLVLLDSRKDSAEYNAESNSNDTSVSNNLEKRNVVETQELEKDNSVKELIVNEIPF